MNKKENLFSSMGAVLGGLGKEILFGGCPGEPGFAVAGGKGSLVVKIVGEEVHVHVLPHDDPIFETRVKNLLKANNFPASVCVSLQWQCVGFRSGKDKNGRVAPVALQVKCPECGQGFSIRREVWNAIPEARKTTIEGLHVPSQIGPFDAPFYS